MRLAVQELLWGAADTDRLAHASQSVGEKLTIRINEFRSLPTTSDQPLGISDSIRETGRRQVDLPHAGMQPFERVRVLGWRESSGLCSFVVGPQRYHEPVAYVGHRLDSRLKRSYRAIPIREALSKSDLELRPPPGALLGDPGNSVAGQQAHGEFV